MHKKGKIILFTKYPDPGRVKTRLIPTLGAQDAALLHREMAEHTLKTIKNLTQSEEFNFEVRYSGCEVEQMRKWMGSDLQYRNQGEGGLGNRMAKAFDDAFNQGMDNIIVIGTDCPEISPRILKDGLRLLNNYDIVLGPAIDGGYYLIGLAKMVDGLFMDIPWGTDRVFELTQKVAKELKLKSALLKKLNDCGPSGRYASLVSGQKKNRFPSFGNYSGSKRRIANCQNSRKRSK